MSLKLLKTESHMDLSSMKELPDSYAWSSLDADSCAWASVDDGCLLSCSSEHVPVINLQDPNAMKHVCHACKTWGVFHVTNHGIPMAVLDDMKASVRKLFSLPIQYKLKAARAPDGVSGYGAVRISSFFHKHMWSEGFTIIGSPYEHAKKLWPQDYKNFCVVVEDYNKGMKALANTLMGLILGALGITIGDIEWAEKIGDLMEARPALQLNFYPTCPDPNRAMGLAAHTDSSLLTILHQNNASGLQVQREGMGWVTVPPINGGLVVHVGDLLHILSNGLYPSVLHRAIVNRTQHRLSIAYLCGPPSNVQISPLSNLTSIIHPPVYQPVTWSEYLAIKAKYFNKTLSIVRLSAPMNGFVDLKDHKSVIVG